MLIALVVWLFWPAGAVAQTLITYPRPESSADERASYPVALLALCAARMEQRYHFRPSALQAQQSRNIRLLAEGRHLDILWAVTDAERERLLLPIRIPIDRGLIGWRLLLVRAADEARFSRIRRVTDLAALRAGQGHDWPDVEVLRANGFTVATGSTYEGLFGMLALGHIQYFPRALSEIWPEQAARADLGIAVEKTLALHYPEALYFFVNRNNTGLAQELTACLNSAIDDGSLQALFNTYYGAAIVKAELDRRTIFELDNPLLPPETPLAAKYWFSPLETR